MSCPHSKGKHSQLGVEDTTRPQEDKLHFEGGKTDHLSDCSAMRFSDIKVTKKGFHLGNFSILVF